MSEVAIKDFLGRPVRFTGLFTFSPVAEILQLAAVESICLFLGGDCWGSGLAGIVIQSRGSLKEALADPDLRDLALSHLGVLDCEDWPHCEHDFDCQFGD